MFKNKSIHLWCMAFYEGAKTLQWWNPVYLTSAGTTEYPHWEEWNWTSSHTIYKKITQHGLTIKCKS